jgi:hypothetical protein
MNNHEIRARIEHIYHELLLHPQFFCRPIKVEAYIEALELVLDMLADSSRRADGYNEFRAQQHFVPAGFQGTYERTHSCILSLVHYSSPSFSESMSLSDEYQAAFRAHWEAFLNWRKTKAEQTS